MYLPMIETETLVFCSVFHRIITLYYETAGACAVDTRLEESRVGSN
jgi:hypothetical protein